MKAHTIGCECTLYKPTYLVPTLLCTYVHCVQKKTVHIFFHIYE